MKVYLGNVFKGTITTDSSLSFAAGGDAVACTDNDNREGNGETVKVVCDAGGVNDPFCTFVVTDTCNKCAADTSQATTMSQRNLIVLAVLVAGLTIAVVAMVGDPDVSVSPSDTGQEEAAPDAGNDPDFAMVDDPSWMRTAAATPTLVEYRKTANGDTKQSFESLGPLDVNQTADMRARLRKVVAATYARFERVANKKGSGPDGTEIVADALEQLDVLLMAKRQEAKLAAIESGDYVTVARGDADKVKWPRGYLVSVSGTRHHINGVRVDVVFGINPEHPMVKSVYDEVRLFQGLVREHEIEEFNQLSFDERKAKYDKNRAAVIRLRQLDRSLSETERRAIVDSLMPDFLPGEWHIDGTTYYARLRE